MTTPLQKNPETFRMLGEVLFGTSWQGAMARGLKVNEKTVYRWATKRTEIPDKVWLEIADLCIVAAENLRKWEKLVREMALAPPPVSEPAAEAPQS